VETQHLQQYHDPFVAVVIDPIRTMSNGRVEIGAFRTYPTDHKAQAWSSSGGDQIIPQDKAADFGAHAERYYGLDVSYYKSTMDTLLLSDIWNKYWVTTLSANPLLENREYGTQQIKDLAVKINETRKTSENKLQTLRASRSRTEEEAQLEKLAQAATKVEHHQKTGPRPA
jgi:COP9 signalosome complex subunit 5